MRLTILLLTVGFLNVCANGLSQTVTLSAKNMPLPDIFRAVKKQTGYVFVYTDRVLNAAKPVTIQAVNIPLQQFLSEIFKEQPLTFDISDNNIFLSRKPDSSHAAALKPFALFANPFITIRGQVNSENGVPVEGASVLVKGSTLGTKTDASGRFTLENVNKGDILVISFIGFNTLEYKVTGTDDIKIRLVRQVSVMDTTEIVYSTGFQYIPKERATGSFVHLDNKAINRTPTTDILSRIQGMASGVQLNKSSDDYGEQFTNIEIRGLSTIQSNAAPLLVVDNFPFEGDLKSINPNDIESITVLKDAAAASIWGSRSGNGVIVIVTKKGRYKQAARVTVTSNLSLSGKPDLKYIPSIKPADYIDWEVDLYKKGFYQSQIDNIYMPPLTPAVEILVKESAGLIDSEESAALLNGLKRYDLRDDLSKYIYRTAVNQQHAVNVTGGSDNHQYYVSFGYDNNTGNKINNAYSRYSLSANNTFSFLNKRLEVAASLWYANSKASGQSNSNNVVATYPYARLADEQGNPLRIDRYRRGFIDTVGSGMLLDWTYYPLNDLKYIDAERSITTNRLGIDVKYKVMGPLEVSVKYLYESGENSWYNYAPKGSYAARDMVNNFSIINYDAGTVARTVPLGGILDKSDGSYHAHNLRGQLSFSKRTDRFGELHAIVGAELRETVAASSDYRSYGYDKENVGFTYMDYANAYPVIIGNSYSVVPNTEMYLGTNDRNISLFGNAAYTLHDKYTLSASARKDGSNQLGVATNNKWSPLWSAGLSWQVSREDFYNIPWLPYLKLRTSFGYQGNVNKNISAVLTTTGVGNNKWRQNSSSIMNFPNEFLRWEQTSIANLALDFGTRNNRVAGSLEYYTKKGKDLIGVDILPPSSGQTSYTSNAANMKGSGWDLTISSININKKVKWTSTFLLSYSVDEITNYKSKATTIKSFVLATGSFNPREGSPVNSLFAFQFAGLDPATGDPLGILKGNTSNDYNQLINSTDFNDMKYQGRTTAPYFGSLLNTVSYQGFEFSFNIVYKFGHVFRRQSIYYSNAINYGNGHSDYSNRWQQPGDELKTTVPSFVYPVDQNRDMFYNYSTALTEKADLIRLQDIRIGYDLLKLLGARNKVFREFTLYATGSNLCVLWVANKQNLDPDYLPSISSMYTKPARLFSFGCKTTF